MTLLSRRTVSASLLSLPLLGACQSKTEPDTAAWTSRLETIEATRGGRIGVAALDLQTGRTLNHRPDERFAMCSTFKWMLGGVVLARVDAGEETLSRAVPIREADMVFHAPTTEPAIGSTLSVEQLCAATIANSDNPAANLLLASMGGPAGFTRALRAMGDSVTRLDRYEPQLNANTPDDPRDTTTPRAMVELMARLVFGDILTPASRQILQDWMLAAVTGNGRLKAGLPGGWRLGHKTGTSNRDANNDVGFVLPPSGSERGPVLIVSFSDGPGAMTDIAETSHADVARAVMSAFAQT